MIDSEREDPADHDPRARQRERGNPRGPRGRESDERRDVGECEGGQERGCRDDSTGTDPGRVLDRRHVACRLELRLANDELRKLATELFDELGNSLPRLLLGLIDVRSQPERSVFGGGCYRPNA